VGIWPRLAAAAYRGQGRPRTPTGLSCSMWVRDEGGGASFTPEPAVSLPPPFTGAAALPPAAGPLQARRVGRSVVAVLVNHRPAIRSNEASSEVHLHSPRPLFSLPPKLMGDSEPGDVNPSFAPSGYPECTWGSETGPDTGLECFGFMAFTHSIRLCTSHCERLRSPPACLPAQGFGSESGELRPRPAGPTIGNRALRRWTLPPGRGSATGP
jgi:hypothetical protein